MADAPAFDPADVLELPSFLELEARDPAAAARLRARALLGARGHAFARALATVAELGPFVLVLPDLSGDDAGGAMPVCIQTNIGAEHVDRADADAAVAELLVKAAGAMLAGGADDV